MNRKIFKVHTDTLGRLTACIQKAMYGISKTAFTQQLPPEFREAQAGDIVFISEKETSKNALFGPFYLVDNRPPIVIKSRKGAWLNVDVSRTPPSELAYWVELEKRDWCLLFDKTLADRLSIVWPNNWAQLKVNLPSWGLVKGDDAMKLLDFAIKNETEARDFMTQHGVWQY